jgi:hypothetical protein
MPLETEYKRGQHNVLCAICQSHFKSSQIRERWDKLLVCERDWDPDPRPSFKPMKPTKDPRPVPNMQGPEVIEYRDDL